METTGATEVAQNAITNPAAQWVDTVLLVLAACLQLRMSSYQAESRILRKLHNPVRKNLGTEMKEQPGKKRFAELVLHLCKGDNRQSGRMVNSAFEWFYVLASALQLVVRDLRITDSYLALALPVLVRSFIVFGAGVLKVHEVCFVFALSILYGSLVYISSLGVFPISDELHSAAFALNWVLFGVFVLNFLIDFCIELRGSGDHLFCVAQAILKNREKDAQKRRWERMSSIMRSAKPDERLLLWSAAWRRSLVDLVAYPLQCAVSIILFHNLATDIDMARYVGLEVLEMFSILLSFVNDNLVEPRLFVELLKHAYDNEEEDGDELSSVHVDDTPARSSIESASDLVQKEDATGVQSGGLTNRLHGQG